MKNAVLAEFLGTGFLLVSVVGSGIMAETLAGGNIALALLANAIATGCMLYCIITLFGAVSGAHFNPAVSIAFALRGETRVRIALLYILVQLLAGALGALAVHLMFDLPILQLSTKARTGVGHRSTPGAPPSAAAAPCRPAPGRARGCGGGP